MTKIGITAGVSPCKPSWGGLEPATGDMRVPDGRRVADIPPEEFRRLVKSLGIRVDASMGHVAVAESYQAHLEAVGKAAYAAAIASWLEARRAVG